jgi:DNA (cytosine-5)-methyltransferase 1
MLNGLGICSGIGGLERALEPWVRWVACCEREPYPAGVLLGNTGIPIWDDLETFPWDDFKGKIDIVAAGFPCQDVSIAGLQKGMDGERSVLVFKIIAGCRQMGCEYIFLENVPPVTTIMGSAIVTQLAACGYDARWITIRVPIECQIKEGERWFLFSKARSKRVARLGKDGNIGKDGKKRIQRQKRPRNMPNIGIKWDDPFGTGGGQRLLDRESDGVQNWRDRIKALGNAVVSEQAKEAFKILSGME